MDNLSLLRAALAPTDDFFFEWDGEAFAGLVAVVGRLRRRGMSFDPGFLAELEALSIGARGGEDDGDADDADVALDLDDADVDGSDGIIEDDFSAVPNEPTPDDDADPRNWGGRWISGA